MKRFLLPLALALALTGPALAQNNRSVQLSQDPSGAIQYNTSTKLLTLPGALTVPGASELTGRVTVNGDSNLMCASLVIYGAPAAATDTAFYVATRPLLLISASEVHAVAAGGTSTAIITKDTGTTAPGAGTSLHASGSFNLNGTANTVQNAVITATTATKTFAAGDRLSIKFANAIQASSGITVTACFAPI